jgi:hypothetical protein
MEDWFLRKETYIEAQKGVNSFWIFDFGFWIGKPV